MMQAILLIIIGLIVGYAAIISDISYGSSDFILWVFATIVAGFMVGYNIRELVYKVTGK